MAEEGKKYHKKALFYGLKFESGTPEYDPGNPSP
jgi:hypothetical protein